jgi:hypothetical protein
MKMNLNLPLKCIQIIHLGSGELSLVNLVTEFPNPNRGPNATETVEFSSILPRLGVDEFVKDLCMIHAHGSVIVKVAEIGNDGFEIERPHAI